jgi:acyl dehydratase
VERARCQCSTAGSPESELHMTESNAGASVPDSPTRRGRYFEELSPGEIIRHAIGRTITEADNVFFTCLTMNPAPSHIDASVEPHHGRLVNGMLTLGLVLGLTVYDMTLFTSSAMLGLTDIKFMVPVFHGDSIHAETEVIDTRLSKSHPDSGVVTFLHRGINQHGETVLEATRAQLMYRREAVVA